MNCFYVYVHRAKDTNQVFYVGKGKNKRKDDCNSRSQKWRDFVSAHGFYSEIVLANLTEENSFLLEKELIAFYGRDQLCNYSNGGEGPSGAKHSKEAVELKKATSKSMWEKNPDRKIAMSNRALKQWNGEARENIVNRMKAAQEKMAQTGEKKNYMRNVNPVPVMCIETKQSFRTLADAVDWVRLTGISTKPSQRPIALAARGFRKSAYKHTWTIL